MPQLSRYTNPKPPPLLPLPGIAIPGYPLVTQAWPSSIRRPSSLPHFHHRPWLISTSAFARPPTATGSPSPLPALFSLVDLPPQLTCRLLGPQLASRSRPTSWSLHPSIRIVSVRDRHPTQFPHLWFSSSTILYPRQVTPPYLRHPPPSQHSAHPSNRPSSLPIESRYARSLRPHRSSPSTLDDLTSHSGHLFSLKLLLDSLRPSRLHHGRSAFDSSHQQRP